MNTDPSIGNESVESESDRIMREQGEALKAKKKQPKVLKEESRVFDSANH